jgi:hypothetical protein
MSKFFKQGEEDLVERPTGDENNVYFNGWAIRKTEKGYVVTYISSEHGGGERELVIDEETFNNAKAGKIGLLEILNMN